MVGEYGPWEAARLRATSDEIARRAQVTPTLTAVRVHGESATYRELAGALVRYGRVSDLNGLGVGSTIAAAILHCLPRIGRLGEPMAVVHTVRQVLDWLARDLDEGFGGLRAIG
ncbi:hypothetical protein VX037_00415 [Gordonia sp. Z-3]|jgi:hypothetical protein|uniref:Uncharacterized protein n=2 Tax=Gordonia TaxID=2053 RepID=A0A9X3D480_9ACTN|nr:MULTISPECIES: hypothetical protein [Gordonia]MAU82295.1 hypothetical protein [Gordonia sp. (in: high G+C Gram-positive bacteria)]MCF3940800.1 hypothetical protein [Gordonia tangerina]MCX2964375.1 hypothetical protein [Gordonia aquimaris]MED5799493.1 hypothetical protein [Gordonia sp. Z-3]